MCYTDYPRNNISPSVSLVKHCHTHHTLTRFASLRLLSPTLDLFQGVELDFHKDLNLTGQLLDYYLADLGHTCDDMLLHCVFEGLERNCSDIFTAIVTDEGECCAFNVMPKAIMYKADAVGVSCRQRL